MDLLYQPDQLLFRIPIRHPAQLLHGLLIPQSPLIISFCPKAPVFHYVFFLSHIPILLYIQVIISHDSILLYLEIYASPFPYLVKYYLPAPVRKLLRRPKKITTQEHSQNASTQPMFCSCFAHMVPNSYKNAGNIDMQPCIQYSIIKIKPWRQRL